MKLIIRFYEFLLHSNLYIAFAAVCLTVQTQVQLGLVPQWRPYLLLIFFATLFEYNLHRLVTVLGNREALHLARYEWIRNHLRLFYFIAFASIAGFLITCLFAQAEVLIALLPLGILTLLYSLPLYRKGKRLKRLREVPLVKIFIISLVWSLSTILLPLIHSQEAYKATHLASLIAERFLFIFAITIPFDIRDAANDQAAGLKTLPHILGEKTSIRIAQILLIFFLLLCFFHYAGTVFSFLIPPLFISGIFTLYAVSSENMRKRSHYYYGILDGTMILQGALAVLSFYLFRH